MAGGKTERIEVENVLHPGRVRSVDAAMYGAMKRALLKVLPKKSPGLTESEISERLTAHLPKRLFAGGGRAGWWQKTVELDLEAKGVIVRAKGRPLRLHKM
jgi:hypothetical protein